MDKFLPLPDDEKKKMQPWKSGAVKYPQVGVVRQPCTIPDKSPEEEIPEEAIPEEAQPTEKGDGDSASASASKAPIEGQAASEGAHFCYEKPVEQQTSTEVNENKEIDQWFDIV